MLAEQVATPAGPRGAPSAPWGADGVVQPGNRGPGDPLAIARRLAGGDHVVLPGFPVTRRARSAASILQPGVTYVGSDVDAFEVQAALARSAQLRKRLLVLTAIVSHVGAIAATAWYVGARAPAAAGPRPASWSVSYVVAGGVVVASAEAGNQTVFIGQRLPNAEVLVDVNPAAASYVTNRSTVILRAPHALAPGAAQLTTQGN